MTGQGIASAATRASQTLSLNMKLIAHYELAKFGGLYVLEMNI